MKMSEADKEAAAIEMVAQMMTARQPYADYVAPILEANINEIRSHTPTSGGHGTKNWVASMRSFGKMLIAIADREEAKIKRS